MSVQHSEGWCKLGEIREIGVGGYQWDVENIDYCGCMYDKDESVITVSQAEPE